LLRGSTLIVIVAIALGVVAIPADSSAQIEIGYCPSDGGMQTFTICFLVCCPGDASPTELCATTPPVNCADPIAVMNAIAAAVAALAYGGNPVFGPAVVVATPIVGQTRYQFPLDPGFAAAGCCVIGGSAHFDCGTVSLQIDEPCAKTGSGGGGGGGGGPIKPKILGPAPGFPATLVIQFIGCPPIFVPLTGTETAADVQALLLAALQAAGYTAFINGDGDIEVTTDCTGNPPLGVDEFGLQGGIPMSLELEIGPRPSGPIGVEERSWGAVKSLYGED
jgi:hypothetical protein